MYEVYVYRYDGEVLYVGEGVLNRHNHCTSGVSHVFGLNELYFTGGRSKISVEVKYYETKKLAEERELFLIKTLKPKLNKKHNSVSPIGNTSKIRKRFIDVAGFTVTDKYKPLVDEFFDFYKYSDIINGNIEIYHLQVYKRLGLNNILNLVLFLRYDNGNRYSAGHQGRLFDKYFSEIFGYNLKDKLV